MKLQAFLIVAAIGCLTGSGWGQAQLSADVTLNWKNTTTGMQTPLLQGDAAAIWVDVAFSPAVGTQVMTPQGPGIVAGLGSVFFDLIGSGPPVGNWTTSGTGFGGTPAIDGPGTNTNWNNYGRRSDVAGGWALGGVGVWGGWPLTIYDFVAGQAGQFPMTGPGNPVNPVREIHRVGFTPVNYAPTVISFQSQRSVAAAGTGVTLLVELPGNTFTQFNVPLENISWGAVHIPIPSPSGAAVMVVGGVVLSRRGRGTGGRGS